MILVFRNKKQKSAGIQKDGGFFPQIFGLILFLDLIHNDKDC